MQILGDECWQGDLHLRFPKNIISSRRHGVVEQDLRARTGKKMFVQHN